MNYRKVNDKWVINKNGTYISLTASQIDEMEKIIADIKSGENKFYVEDSRRLQSIKI